ncbi:hypothetical protein RUND412_010965 [Rhizina undulata]
MNMIVNVHGARDTHVRAPRLISKINIATPTKFQQARNQVPAPLCSLVASEEANVSLTRIIDRDLVYSKQLLHCKLRSVSIAAETAGISSTLSKKFLAAVRTHSEPNSAFAQTFLLPLLHLSVACAKHVHPEFTMNDYERQREINIQANKLLLASLGLENPAAKFTAPPKTKKKTATASSTRVTRKRKSSPSDDSQRRKSQRARKAVQRYQDEDTESDEYDGESDGCFSDDSQASFGPGKRKRTKRSDSFSGSVDGDGDGLRRRIVNGRNVQHISSRSKKERNPRVFGNIPGVPVGTWWPTRMACSAAGVHAPTVAGISGTAATGAYSVAISGGYEDDIDEGFRFTYTGSGGRDLKGTKNKPKNLRTAPQSFHQQLTGGNLALKVSCDTKKPVRVIRGYKGELGPPTGYRYDGLYEVAKCWEDIGMVGFKVWKYAFKRLDGQPPLDVKAGDPNEGAGSDSEEATNSEDEESANHDDADEEEDIEDEEAKEEQDAEDEEAKDEEDIKDVETKHDANKPAKATTGKDKVAAQPVKETKAPAPARATKIDVKETKKDTKPDPKSKSKPKPQPKVKAKPQAKSTTEKKAAPEITNRRRSARFAA